MKKSLLLITLITLITLAGCSSLPRSFSTENIMKIQQGMSSKEILQMFGPPKDIRQSICGSATPKPWNCTTWTYGHSPYASASFTFSGDTNENLILNNFEIDRGD